ncbi:MAG: response regulator [Lachnospiraceae bacterium]|nr:response regulator [Lachnospiraceae bacterium]
MSSIEELVLDGMAVITMLFAIHMFLSEEKNIGANWYLGILCLASSIWNFSLIVLARCTYQSSDFFQSVLWTGVYIFWSAVSLAFTEWVPIKERTKKLIRRIAVLGGLVTYPFVVSENRFYFYRDSSNPMFLKRDGIGFRVCTIYFCGMLLILLILSIHGIVRAKKKRERQMGISCLLAIGMLIAAMVGDYLEVKGESIIICRSGLDQFCCTLFLYLGSGHYYASRITVRNVSEYIYSVVKIPILLLTEEGEIEICNTSATEFFDMPSDQIAKKKLEDLFYFDENQGGKEAECKINGAKCDLSISIIYDRYKQPLGKMIIITDMTDKLKIIEELNESRMEAIRANEAKSAFLANMSHEIRTPMNAIIGMSEMLLTSPLSSEAKEDVSSINRAGKGLLEIINDILDFTKIEAGMFKIVQAEYSFSTLINDVVHMISIRLSSKPIHFLVYVDRNIPDVLIGDDVRIRQILINVLGNAVKFTNQGFISLMITGKTDDGMVELKIEIEDSGIGIRKEDCEHIFGVFSQVDSVKNRHIKGTGLGLSISKNLTELMGGRIGVESIYGTGTKFTIYLPQKTAGKTEIYGEKKECEESVLVIENDPRIAETIRAIFLFYNAECEILPSFPENYYGQYDKVFIRRKLFMQKNENPNLYPAKEKIYMILECDEKKGHRCYPCREIYLPDLQMELSSILYGRKTKEEIVKVSQKGEVHNACMERHILVVDDNPLNLHVAAGFLARYGLKVETVQSGEEAIKHARQEAYDLIFMDHLMPGLNGEETLNQIQTDSQTKNRTTPVILMTALERSEAQQLTDASGFCAYLLKPVNQESLEAILKTYLKETCPLPERKESHISSVTYLSLKKACVEKDYALLQAYLTDLARFTYPSAEASFLSRLTSALDHYEYDSLISILDEQQDA